MLAILETFLLIMLGAIIGALTAWHWCKTDTEYYRTIVYAYEQQKTRKLLG